MTDDHGNWQALYSASESRWQDVKRISIFLFPIVIMVLFTAVYTVICAIIQFGWLPSEQSGKLVFYLNRLQVFITILAPILAMLFGSLFIFREARDFVLNVYKPSEDEKLSSLILRRLLGVPPAPPPLNNFLKYPFIVIKEPVLKENHWVRWSGGPAILVIYDGVALYLERGNQFSRVVGPGAPMPFLERYEKVKEVVDLRPQTKEGEIEPWTKDGIRIKLKLRAEVQVNSSVEYIERSADFRYPFDPDAVKLAVEYTSVVLADGKLQERPWLGGAWGNITGAINAFVAGHSLDELFLAPGAEIHANSTHDNNHATEDMEQILSRRITNQVTDNISINLQKNGVKVLSLQIVHIDIPSDVRNLRTKYWESLKQKISAQRNSRAEAERIRARELAHAEAQRTMLTTITKRLENIDPKDLTEPLILSLSGILDQGLDDPIVRPLIAKESFAVLERMRKLLEDRF